MVQEEIILEYLKNNLDNYRLEHTLSVREECKKLSAIYSLPENNKAELTTAALLHDITKPLNTAQHIELCKKFGKTEVDYKEYILSPKTFHSYTGALLAAHLFPDTVDKRIENDIRYHTTGREKMTLCEALLYLADYIEPKRKFDDCIHIRDFFYSGLVSGNDKYTILKDTLIESFNLTITELMKEGLYISENSFKARNYYISHRDDNSIFEKEAAD